VFTDATIRNLPHLAVVLESLKAAGIDVVVYDEVAVEPTDASFKRAAQFASEGRFDGFVSVGGGFRDRYLQAANLYASHPAEFLTTSTHRWALGSRCPGR